MDAWRIANSFVRDSLEMARELEKKCQHLDAMVHLGHAIHTMNDFTSPPHQNYQVWDENLSLPKKAWNHTRREWVDPGAGSALDASTRRAWELFSSGGPIPREVLRRP
jgi:hypothetical protein